MRLTGEQPSPSVGQRHQRLSSAGAIAVVLAVLLLIFELDRVSDAAPVQHLYYLPIIFAGVRFGRRGGLVAATLAIVFYHLANPRALTLHYEQSDVLQVAVFVAVGLISDKLADDARRLHHLAMTDDLTGLHNLRSFEAQLRTMVPAARHTTTPLALLVLDVDRLKSLNDVHGHLTGADAVRTVGQIIASRLPPDAVACRYGGDEFVIGLPQSDELRAIAVAEDLCRAVNEAAPVLAGVRFPVATLSISVGVACRTFEPSATLDATADIDRASEALFHAADQALYAAKANGRNRVSVAPQGV
jgi:diguanylate cyclase (GGDEF)-like protein